MRIHLLVGRVTVGLSALGALFAAPASARADTVCGSYSTGWNAPLGAAVFIIDTPPGGIIAQLLAQVGEVRSHSMLSHGPNTWVTHSTATTPGTVAECSLPIDTSFLRAATPGVETIDQGAAYTFIFKNGGTPMDVYYQSPNPNNISASASFLGNDYLPTNEWGDSFTYHTYGSGSNTVYGIAYAFNNGSPSSPQLSGNSQIFYGFHQYMNIGTTAHGYPDPNQQGWGTVCSTTLAMWQHDSFQGQPGYTGDVKPRTYDTTHTTNAATSLYNYVYNQCHNGLTIGLDGSQPISAIWAATCIGQSVCANAADELANTFVNGNSESNVQSDWLNVVHNNSAVSVSPDDIACWNDNGTGPGCVGSGSSVWGWDNNHLVQWNSGGNSYGCWSQ